MTQQIPTLRVGFVLSCSKCVHGYQLMIFHGKLVSQHSFFKEPHANELIVAHYLSQRQPIPFVHLQAFPLMLRYTI